MSRRASRDTNDSLDLFLDALSNTFGCIVFIALIMCVILQTTGTGSGQSVDPAKLTERLAQVRTEWEEAERQSQDQKQEFRDIEKKSDPTLIKRRERLRTKRNSEEALKKQIQADIEADETEWVEAKEKLDKVLERIAELEVELATAESTVEAAKNRSAPEISLRQVRETKKQNRDLLLMDGRLAFVFEFVGDIPTGYGDNIDVTQVGTGKVVSMKKNRGVRIRTRDLPQLQHDLNAMLNGLDTEKHALFVAVGSDSWEEYLMLRDEFERRGFESNWLPWEKNTPVPLGDSSNSSIQ